MPVITSGLDVAVPVTNNVAAPVQEAVYFVIGLPPEDVGGENSIVAPPSRAVAERMVGALATEQV